MSGRAEDPVETSTRRKRIVALVDELDDSITVDRLVDAVDESAVAAPTGPDAASWERLHERLHDEDLPALDRAGLLVFDEERGVVTPRGVAPSSASGTSPGREADDDDAAPAAGRTAGAWLLALLGVASLVTLLATAFDLGPFVRAPDAAVSTALAVGLSLLSLLAGLWE